VASSTDPIIAVLMGGPSSEREVSLSSGRECAAALRAAGFRVAEIDAGRDLPARLHDSGATIAFNALHGRWGEDGCVQGLLEWLGVPYTHSGVLASALAMDKQRTKAAYAAEGLPVAESGLFPAAQVRAGHVMAPPYVVKPNDEGSSVGIYMVHGAADGPPQLAADMPEMVMVERFAPGRELTTTVLGEGIGGSASRALTVTDIVTEGWYDYAAKYAPGGSRHILPADIPNAVFDACLRFAVRAHETLGCRGVSRTDFRWDESRGLDGLVLLETNTQPGMTPTSLTPEQARHCGIDFPTLCRWLVEDASCGR